MRVRDREKTSATAADRNAGCSPLAEHALQHLLFECFAAVGTCGHAVPLVEMVEHSCTPMPSIASPIHPNLRHAGGPLTKRVDPTLGATDAEATAGRVRAAGLRARARKARRRARRRLRGVRLA